MTRCHFKRPIQHSRHNRAFTGGRIEPVLPMEDEELGKMGWIAAIVFVVGLVVCLSNGVGR